MTTLAKLKSNIADELVRDDLGPQIAREISNAIKHYQLRQFWFNDQLTRTNTAEGQEYYPLPDDFVDMDSIVVTVTDRQYPLTQRTWQYIEDISWGDNTWQGYPQDYAIFANTFRLYPIPNGKFELRLAYTREVPEPSSDGASNVWTTDAEELIRCRAKRMLFNHVLYEPQQGQLMQQLEGEALQNLYKRTAKQGHTNILRPTMW